MAAMPNKALPCCGVFSESTDESILLLCGQFPGEQARIDIEEMDL